MTIQNRRPLHFPTIVISDFHLGKEVAMTAHLLEFLENTSCEKLILNGDIIDGWEIMARKHKKFDEMTLRVIDAINKKATTGTQVTYVSGNHDEKLRGAWSTKHNEPRHLNDNKPSRIPFQNKIYTFTSAQNRALQSQIKIKGGMTYKAPDGRKFLCVHGDQFDEAMRNKRIKHWAEIVDPAYDALIKADRRLNTSIASWAKRKAKGLVECFETAVKTAVNKGSIDGIICGHSHDSKILQEKSYAFLNSGDWVESATALAHDEKGSWQKIEWLKLREQMALGDLPSVQDKNPNAEYRSITQRQVKWIQRIWPAKNYDKKQEKLSKLRDQCFGPAASNTTINDALVAKYEKKRQELKPF